MIPQFLEKPSPLGHCYGTVKFNESENCYEIRAEPSVLEMAKRVFPGCSIRRSERVIRFRPTRRSVGDLNWLLLRFPMVIECEAKYAEDRRKAILHAERVEENVNLKPTTPPREFVGELFDFQALGVTFLLNNERAILADDMGLGKTVTALASIAAANGFPAIIVTPKNVNRQWSRMVDTFLSVPNGASLLGEMTHVIRGQTPYELPEVPIYITHYGLLQYWCETLQEIGASTLIFDEVQELRRTQSYKYSAATILSQDANRVWGLSGTPIYNYGDEIWAVLNAVEFQCLGDRESFTREWCTGYGTRVVEHPDVLGDHLRREGLMLRRRKSEVQSELPPKRRVMIDIEHDEGEYKKLIARAVELARSYEGIKGWSEKGQVKSKIDRETRYASGMAKREHVASFIHSLLDSGEKVLVFGWHHDVHDSIMESLSMTHRIVKITGRESEAEKETSIRKFAGGMADAVILSLRATAGLDGLQGRGTCVVFAELDWSPGVHSQCEDRLHRMGFEGRDSILSYYLVSSTSFDETMREALGLKVGQFTGIMGDETPTDESNELAGTAAKEHLDKVIERLTATV